MRSDVRRDEEQRLAALRAYNVLDTPPEREFDDLVALAARVCGAPIAFLGLLDADRQWFKAQVGFEVNEVPLEFALCANAILQPDALMEVSDLRPDPRFDGNLLVAGALPFRSYAGVPLLTPEGFAIGSFCVMDYEPRELDDLQRKTLRVLARQAMAQMELRRKSRELEDARRMVDTQVARRTADLLARNEELEGFTHSVSHDMRAPLHAIVAASRMLQEDEGDRLSEEGRRDLARLASAALRMSRLVDDLLEYARLGAREVRRERVDLGEIVRKIAAEVAAEEPNCGLRVEVADLGETMGDHRILGMAIRNLLENACKYRQPGQPALIEVGVSHMVDEKVYFMRDKGIGFAPEQAERIFRPFERLHRNEAPGTGIGLANVRRAITRHGGRIWAESEPNQGATFRFTLPN